MKYCQKRKWTPEEIPPGDHYELTIPQVAALTNRGETAVRRLFDEWLIRWWYKTPDEGESIEQGHQSVRVTNRAEIARYQMNQILLQERKVRDEHKTDEDRRLRRGRQPSPGPASNGQQVTSTIKPGKPLSQKEFSRQFLR